MIGKIGRIESTSVFTTSVKLVNVASVESKVAVVEARLPELTVVDDTVMYNADAFKLEEGAMVEELIRKLPGIVEESEGNYTFNGKSVSQILVDGKEFFGNNRRMVLENLPAEIVDKVKAYDRKSDRNTI